MESTMKTIKILFLSSLTILASCGSRQSRIKRAVTITTKPANLTTTQPTPNQQAITIWIHGSCTLRPISTFIHACPPGLHKIANLPTYYRLQSLAYTLAQANPIRFPLEHFYAFGWPGDLNFEQRKNEAKKLYAELKNLTAIYTEHYGVKPTLRIITHSHGGNVCLNLARAQEPDDGIVIEEAILLASPIQHDTSGLAEHPIFKKIYSLYSTFDTLQVADPQGLYDIPSNTKHQLKFSERRFPDYPNVHQAHLRINDHGLMHLAFIMSSFIKILPKILDELDRWEHEAPHMKTPKTERILAIKTVRTT
jgi:hypothetical protein